MRGVGIMGGGIMGGGIMGGGIMGKGPDTEPGIGGRIGVVIVP
jgi:hypothetical protein